MNKYMCTTLHCRELASRVLHLTGGTPEALLSGLWEQCNAAELLLHLKVRDRQIGILPVFSLVGIYRLYLLIIQYRCA